MSFNEDGTSTVAWFVCCERSDWLDLCRTDASPMNELADLTHNKDSVHFIMGNSGFIPEA